MCPLFQTSANLSGEPPPASFDQVAEPIVDAVDLAIDGGALTGLPSTVVDVSGLDRDGSWQVLRAGGLSEDELAARMARIGQADEAMG
jgi:L-threonylcarbamoyladenylate synthase